jgi:endoglycosylceramidase
LSWVWDGAAATFKARYSTARASGTGAFPAGSISTFFVHPRFFPRGYRVQVAGGTVTSAPNASLLTVAAAPGASEVSVTVTPKP